MFVIYSIVYRLEHDSAYMYMYHVYGMYNYICNWCKCFTWPLMY